MQLRARRRLLNTLTICYLAVAVGGLWWAWQTPLTAPKTQTTNLQADQPRSQTIQEKVAIVDATDTSWQRPLRQPLYDPPPPPEVVVKKKPRPIRVKLMGTVIEPDNSQAFLRSASGSVELKRVGDPVSEDPLDGQIAAINANEVVIQRDDGEVRLTVDGQN